MVTLIHDRRMERELIAQRRAQGTDKFDEVWDGVYVMCPMPDDEHQKITTRLAGVFDLQIGLPPGSQVRAGVNVSDRLEDWKKNFRCPDVAVFLPGTRAVCKGAFWFGGPDFAVEIVSKGDRARKKCSFYAKIGTRELLLIDRYPWSLELYRLSVEGLQLVGRSRSEDSNTLESEALRLSFRLAPGADRPHIAISGPDEANWLT